MIEILSLRKSFQGKKVLDGVNLSIREGQITTIIGMSGTGKSVLLKNIIGLIRPDGGQIFVDGLDVTTLSERKLNALVRSKMSMVFQEAALWDSLTIYDNIALALRVHKHLSRAEIDRSIRENLELVGLHGIENAYPAELSGGMKKRVGVARAIAIRPRYLLYDEPTTGLDPINANIINNLILRLDKHLGVTSIVVTHDINSVERIADRVAMLHEGKIIVDIPKEDMWKHEHPVFRDFIRGYTGEEEGRDFVPEHSVE